MRTDILPSHRQYSRSLSLSLSLSTLTHHRRGCSYNKTPDEMMKKVAKSQPEDLSSLYDLEYRANEDDAWYSVHVVLDAHAETLTVKYMCSPEVYEVVFSAGGFETEAQVDGLVRRFRPVSSQMQDHQCGKISTGTAVCAAHGSGDDDLRFYDAVVEAVNRQEHSFADGEECLCTFVLFWQHGRGRGTLTSANIESICLVEHFAQIDPRISAFAVMAKEKITGKNNICVSIEKNLESSQDRILEMETSVMLKNLMPKNEDLGRISNCNYWNSQEDEDMGPQPCNVNGLAKAKGQDVIILINNLEKDLTHSSIEKFIHKKTTILPQAFVFPRLLSDPFARGAIVVDCMRKVQIIYEFLDNPNHLIVSSRGRPWVITEKPLVGISRTTIWDLSPMDLDDTQYKRTDEELEMVHLGTESYKRAKQLRDLFIEFIHHESQVCKKLVLEEKKILQSFQPA